MEGGTAGGWEGGRKADKLVGNREGFQDSLPKGGGISLWGVSTILSLIGTRELVTRKGLKCT